MLLDSSVAGSNLGTDVFVSEQCVIFMRPGNGASDRSGNLVTPIEELYPILESVRDSVFLNFIFTSNSLDVSDVMKYELDRNDSVYMYYSNANASLRALLD